ncbi:hypothetical protein GUITHDRAFT_155621 [Guillardia theta CCMP2712]|uniref:Uncharacterized protein n=1 Tax=Guillardia theta (strain CCMP2712) TaxID=905079 RepID=L1IFC5_GUITC|nr:hypothetical protein GUITHDRAFT_155621 [Guillardia theta CCMP2712]EKX34933.1 hypothetical protein GUITHDRAFT_155621 [Guillardia theta CCMP2712]|eukprot:XP_005821913.1 hypothetical protein GUITHDRAFT_155621 [Guillardia theta CCMP2712]
MLAHRPEEEEGRENTREEACRAAHQGKEMPRQRKKRRGKTRCSNEGDPDKSASYGDESMANVEVAHESQADEVDFEDPEGREDMMAEDDEEVEEQSDL